MRFSTIPRGWGASCWMPSRCASRFRRVKSKSKTDAAIQLSLDFIEERGQPIGALLTMRDAESVRRIENEIELSRRLAAIGRLTSGVAHEVKNPINAIVIHLEILRERLLQLDPETRRHMDIIATEIQRLDRVVKTLVDFTRPDRTAPGRGGLAQVDGRSSVAGRTRGATARSENCAPGRCAAAAGAHRLGSGQTGPAQCACSTACRPCRKAARSRSPASAHENSAKLEIRDQGAGIDPEIRDKIFNLYFTTKKSGSGIGLAVSYRVLQLHNGTLEFESEAGKGTTFRLILPLAVAADKVAAESRGA